MSSQLNSSIRQEASEFFAWLVGSVTYPVKVAADRQFHSALGLAMVEVALALCPGAQLSLPEWVAAAGYPGASKEVVWFLGFLAGDQLRLMDMVFVHPEAGVPLSITSAKINHKVA